MRSSGEIKAANRNALDAALCIHMQNAYNAWRAYLDDPLDNNHRHMARRLFRTLLEVTDLLGPDDARILSVIGMGVDALMTLAAELGVPVKEAPW